MSTLHIVPTSGPMVERSEVAAKVRRGNVLTGANLRIVIILIEHAAANDPAFMAAERVSFLSD